MSRKFKPKPDNKLTERFRGQLKDLQELLDVDEFIEHERRISDNILIADDVIGKGFCEEFLDDALYNQEDSRWSPNIDYGNNRNPWPISEWGYTLIDSPGDQWYENKLKDKAQELYKKLEGYISEMFDVKVILNGGHMNATTFGQDSMIHYDNPDGSNAFFLVFFNDDMNAYDGGELQTYINLNPNRDENIDFHQSETNYSINPKVGRILLVDSRILHRGLAPTRFYPGTRFTIVFKVKFENTTDAYNKFGWKW